MHLPQNGIPLVLTHSQIGGTWVVIHPRMARHRSSDPWPPLDPADKQAASLSAAVDWEAPPKSLRCLETQTTLLDTDPQNPSVWVCLLLGPSKLVVSPLVSLKPKQHERIPQFGPRATGESRNFPRIFCVSPCFTETKTRHQPTKAGPNSAYPFLPNRMPHHGTSVKNKTQKYMAHP